MSGAGMVMVTSVTLVIGALGCVCSSVTLRVSPEMLASSSVTLEISPETSMSSLVTLEVSPETLANKYEMPAFGKDSSFLSTSVLNHFPYKDTNHNRR